MELLGQAIYSLIFGIGLVMVIVALPTAIRMGLSKKTVTPEDIIKLGITLGFGVFFLGVTIGKVLLNV